MSRDSPQSCPRPDPTEDCLGGKPAQAERASLLERERELRERAEAAVRARENILAIVSHDLRGPLGTISMSAALLERDMPEAQRHAQIEIVQRAVATMGRLIQDLLDVNQIASGQLTVSPQPLDAVALLAEARPTLELQASRKQLSVDWRLPPAPLTVQADRTRLLQLLSNLVGNAIKFTPAGGRIEVSAEAEEREARICVADTGPGIAEADLPRIFERFWQSGDGPRRGGVGLGLAISYGIVRAHGGRIWAKSRPGEGSTFCFTLPLAG